MLIFLDLLRAEFQLLCEVFLGHFNRLPSPEHLICEMFVDPVWGSGRRTPPLFHGADPQPTWRKTAHSTGNSSNASRGLSWGHFGAPAWQVLENDGTVCCPMADPTLAPLSKRTVPAAIAPRWDRFHLAGGIC